LTAPNTVISSVSDEFLILQPMDYSSWSSSLRYWRELQI
jgi:hypothetical protein